MNFCPKCGHRLPVGVGRCPNCNYLVSNAGINGLQRQVSDSGGRFDQFMRHHYRAILMWTIIPIIFLIVYRSHQSHQEPTFYHGRLYTVQVKNYRDADDEPVNGYLSVQFKPKHRAVLNWGKKYVNPTQAAIHLGVNSAWEMTAVYYASYRYDWQSKTITFQTKGHAGAHEAKRSIVSNGVVIPDDQGKTGFAYSRAGNEDKDGYGFTKFKGFPMKFKVRIKHDKLFVPLVSAVQEQKDKKQVQMVQGDDDLEIFENPTEFVDERG